MDDIKTEASALPKLVIVEKPRTEFRFRYKTEARSAHGSLYSEFSTKSCKQYPTVELQNYKDAAIIRCTLTQVNSLNRSSLHPHKLVITRKKLFYDDPLLVEVNSEIGFIAIFHGMSIIHTAKKSIINELENKLRKIFEHDFGRCPTIDEQSQMYQNAELDSNNIDLNRVCLRFEALQKCTLTGGWTSICEPIFSDVINNLKSCLTGELKITRLSKASSCVTGNEYLTLLVEKVGKKDIGVRFYQENGDGDLIWDEVGQIDEVHRQYAIVVKTPKYFDLDIKTATTVNIQLFRSSDEAVSTPLQFLYTPHPFIYKSKV